MSTSFLDITLVLLFIMDPLGNLSTFYSLTQELEPARRNRVVFREMAIALGVMLFFNLLGEYIFSFLSLSEPTVRLSSGVILFLIAIKILFTAKDSPRANLPKGEPFIFPLAVPLIAGPALMATIMVYSHIEELKSVMLLAILLAWGLSVMILLGARPIKQVLGTSGLTACERLIGMVLVLIAVQKLMEGALLVLKTHSHSS